MSYRLAEAKGNAALMARNYDAAIHHYTEAIKHAPNNATYYNSRSSCYYGKQQYSNALSDAKIAVDLDPKWYLGYLCLGQAHFGLKQYDEAILAYKKGLEINPDHGGLQGALYIAKDRSSTGRPLMNYRKEADHTTTTTTTRDDLVNNLLGDLNSLSAFDATTLKQRILELLESQKYDFNVSQVDSTFSVKTAIGVLNRMVDDGLIENGGQLWCVALDLFEDARKREMFISMPDDDGKITWLKYNKVNKKNNIDQNLIANVGGSGGGGAPVAAEEIAEGRAQGRE